MPDPRQKLYSALSSKFDLGTFDEFNSKMDNPESRKKLYNSVSSNFDLGSYDEFESKIGGVKKKDGTKPNSTSTSVSPKQVSEQTNGSSVSNVPDIIAKNNEKARSVPKGTKFKLAGEKEKINPNVNYDNYDLEQNSAAVEKTEPKSKNKFIANTAYTYAINNVDKSLAEQRYKDEVDNYQFFDGVKQGMKNTFNTFIGNPLTKLNETLGGNKDFTFSQYKPLENELKQAKIELQEEFGKNKTFSNEEIQERAKKIFIDKDIQEQMHSNIDKALPIGYDREGIWKELKLDQIRSNDILREKIASSEVFKSKIEEFEEFSKNINRDNPTEQDIEKFNILKQEALTAVNGLNYLAKNYDKYVDQAKTDEEKLELFKYNYNDFDKTRNLFYSSALNIMGGTLKLVGQTAKVIDQELGIEPTGSTTDGKSGYLTSEIGTEMMNDAKIASDPFYRYKATKLNDWSDFGSFATQLTSEQLPILATIYLGGTSGVAATSMSSGGQKIKDLEDQEKLPGGKIYSDGEKLATGWLYAGAEFFPEKIGTARILKDLERTVSSASTASRKLFRDSFLKETIKGTQKLAYYSGLEGSTELVTAQGQITIDEELLNIVKSDAENNEQRMESFFSGAIMGGGMTAVGGGLGFVTAQAKLYSEAKDVKEVKSILSNVQGIQNEIETNVLLTDKERTELYKEMNVLTNQAFETIAKNANKATEFSVEEKSALLDINLRQAELKSKYQEIADSNFSKEIKNKKVQELESEYNSLEEKRSSVLKGEFNTIKQNAVQQEATTTETKQEAQPQTEVQKTEQEVIEKPSKQKDIEAKKAEIEKLEKEKQSLQGNRTKINVGDTFNYNFGLARDGLVTVIRDNNDGTVQTKYADGTIKKERKSNLIDYLNEQNGVYNEINKPENTAKSIEINSKIDKIKKEIQALENEAQSNENQINEVNDNAVLEDNNNAIPNPNQINNEVNENNISDINRVELYEKSDGTFNVRETNEDGSLKQILGRFKTKKEAKNYLDSLKNETAPSQVDNVDGNVQPRNNVVDPSGTTEQENNQASNIQPADNGRNIEVKREIKIADKGQSYTVEKVDGDIIITDKKGKAPSKATERKILDEYSKTINFTQGTRVDDSFESSAETFIDDIVEKSQNPSEIAEAIAYVENADMNDGKVDPIQIAIANALGEKSVEKSSFTNINDRNNINQSIALQYFAQKGKGKGLDQIAMEVEYEVFGDYNANNPRITEEDIANFIVDNPRGAVDFLNRTKNEALDKLKTAFTSVTGLPAKPQFIQKAIDQQIELKNQLFAGNSLYVLSDEDLLSLDNDYQQFKQFENNEQQQEAINETPEARVDIKNTAQRGKESRVQETRGTKASAEQREVTQEEKSKIDVFKKWLDDTDKRLKDFGDETLGINIPIVVARGAVKAMKAAVSTAQTVQEIIQAGLDFVKQSEWYQNLSKKEQNDVYANFQDYINKPFQGTETKKSRLKIEEEIQERLDNNESEQDIIDSISDKREKMIAQDYIERQKNLSVPEVRKKIAESFEKADEALQDKKTTTEKIDKAFRNFIARFFDRQFVPKFILNKAGGRLVRNYLIASKGATGYAKQMYDEAYDKIYKGLTSTEIKTLDKMIQLRRFIAIDKNRAENNMPDVVHPDFINRQDAEIELAELEKELGVEKYRDLNKRADNYFDEFRGLLTEMQKSGLISKESLDMFFEIDYQPRMFLEFLQNNETDFVPETSSNASLSADQIRKLEEGLNTSLIYDSQYLLSRSMNIRAKSIAMNNTNKKLVEFMEKQAKVVDDLRNKKDKTQKEKDTIKYFDELSKRVKINPIIGFTDTGSPKYKYALPNGFKNAYYYIDGVKHSIMMEEALHEQYFDSAKGFLNGNTKEVVAMASGTAVVKALATGNNPTFFITNTPRDFFFIVTFSEEYGMSVLVNMAKLTKDATLGIRDIKKGNGNFKNFVKYGGMMDFLKDQGKLKHTEIQKLFNKVDNKKREGFSKVLNAVTLNKLQMYSEIGFRMAVFNRSVKNQLKELGYTKIEDVKDLIDSNGDIIQNTQSRIDDIYTNAVASARGIMDFNQGGKITKDADAFIPYLNAATQGTRVMFDNFRERPFDTTFRTAQTAAIFSGTAIGLSVAMFSAFGDDDDEMTPTERYLYAKKGVSKYDQTNYFIIFTGQKTESGQYSYIRIAKPQQITPFFSMTDGIMTSFIKAKIGDESPTDAIDNVMFAFEKNISPLEFSVTGNIARNPFLKSALSYSTGYDFYRGEDLSYLRGKVPVPAEGFESKTVEDFYKKIGEESGMSPVRFKAAVESFITTPSTSPYVGFLYGGLDAMASDKDGKEVMSKLGKDLLKSTFNRVRKETTDFNRRLENDKALKKKIEQVEIDNLKTKSLFKKYADAYTNKEMSVAEISKELEKVAQDNPFEAKRLKKMIKDKIKNKDVSPYVFEIKYAKSAESKALMLIDLFGDDLKDMSKLEPEEKKLLFQMKKMGAINKEVLFEYNRIITE